MQLTFMTIQALTVACRQSTRQIGIGSVMRVAALAQPLSGEGRWMVMRGNWNEEPDRLVEWRDGLPRKTSIPA